MSSASRAVEVVERSTRAAAGRLLFVPLASRSSDSAVGAPRSNDALAKQRTLSRRATAAVVLVAAVPSVLAAFPGGFIVDDWYYVAESRRAPFTWWLDEVDLRYRPFQTFTHWVTFAVCGDHPTAHLLVAAVAEAVFLWLAMQLAARFLPARLVLVIGAVWALLPNRSAPRLWAAALPVMVAGILVACAGLAATGRTKRPVVATALAVASVVTYESWFALALLAAVVGAWQSGTRWFRQTTAAIAASIIGLAVVWNQVTSPKGRYPVASFSSAVDALVGSGLTHPGSGSMGRLFGVGLVGAVVTGFALTAPARRRLVAATVGFGLALAITSALPLVVAGASFEAHGSGDRLNVASLVGVAVAVGAAIGGPLLRQPVPDDRAARLVAPRTFAAAVTGVGVAATMSWALLSDLDDVREARRDGIEIAGALRSIPDGSVVVLVPRADRNGWSPFGSLTAREATWVLHGVRPRVYDAKDGEVLDDHYVGVRAVGVVDGSTVELGPSPRVVAAIDAEG